MKTVQQVNAELAVLDILRGMAHTADRRVAVEAATIALRWATKTPFQRPSTRIVRITTK